MSNFQSILDRPATESTRPPPFPAGSYACIIEGQPRRDKTPTKGTEYIEYSMRPVKAIEGTVDSDALEEFGKLGDKTLKLTFYITDAAGYRHTEFLENDLGLDVGKATHWEAAQETPGMQCIVHVKHTASRDGKGVYSEIAGTAPID